MNRILFAFTTLIVFSGPAQAANFQCTAKVTEEVPVQTIHFKAPADALINPNESIPAQFIVEKKNVNEHLFNGSYADLKHSFRASSKNNEMEGNILYKTFKATSVRFAFDSETLKFKSGRVGTPKSILAFQIFSADKSVPIVTITPSLSLVSKNGEIMLNAVASKSVVYSTSPFVNDSGRALATYYVNAAAPTLKGRVIGYIPYKLTDEYHPELAIEMEFDCTQATK